MYLYINLEVVKASKKHDSMKHNFDGLGGTARLGAFLTTKLEEIKSWSKSPGLNAGINIGIRVGVVDEVLRRCSVEQIDDVAPTVEKINILINSMFESKVAECDM